MGRFRRRPSEFGVAVEEEAAVWVVLQRLVGSLGPVGQLRQNEPWIRQLEAVPDETVDVPAKKQERFKNGFMNCCYKVMQVFMVTDLFAGQHNTELHGTITDVIYTIVGSALLRD